MREPTKPPPRSSRICSWILPGIKDDVDEVVSSCHDCARDRATEPTEIRLVFPDLPWRPFVRIQIDLVSPFPFTSHGNKYILVIQDYLTKKVLLCPFQNKEPFSIAANLLYEVF